MPPDSYGKKRRPRPRSGQNFDKANIRRGVETTKKAFAREAKDFSKRRAGGQNIVAALGESHSRHDAQRAEKTRQEDLKSNLKNYRPTLLLVLAQFATMLMLALPLFGEPSTVSAVLINGQEMVGLLRRCTGAQCTEWLQQDGVASSGGSAEQSEAPTAGDASGSGLLRRQALSGGTGSEPSDNSSNGGPSGGSVKYDSLAGTMILVVFWTTFYCLLFTAIRYPLFISRPRLPPTIDDLDPADDDDKSRPKDEESQDEIADDRTRWERFKLFGYRAGRAMQVTNALMMPIAFMLVTVYVVKSQGASGMSGLEGIGGGLYLLSFALIGTAYCTAVEFARNDGRLRRWLSFGFFLSKIPWCRDSSDVDEKRVPKQGEQGERDGFRNDDLPPGYVERDSTTQHMRDRFRHQLRIDEAFGRDGSRRVIEELSSAELPKKSRSGRGGRV